MKKTIPSKSLNRLSWMLAFLTNGIACLILLHEKRFKEAVLCFGLTTFTIALIGFVHVNVLVILSNRMEINSGIFIRWRFVLTYLASAAIYLLVWPASIAVFSKKPLIYDDWALMVVFAAGSFVINSVIAL